MQPSFAAGELAPSLYARNDLAKFHVGLALARNFFIDYRGGASNRCGTMAIGRCKQSTSFSAPRNIPFTFSVLQTYTLEFGDLYMRVIMNGGYVLEPSIAIAGITNASPGVFNIIAHGFSVGDQVNIKGAAGMMQVNSTVGYQYLVNSVVDANNVTFTDLDGNIINTTLFGTYTGSGVAARVYTLVTPYASADLPLLKYSQSADTMTLTHTGYVAQQLTRTQHWSWSINPITIGSVLSAPTGLGVTPSTAGSTGYRYVITSIASNNGAESLPSTAAQTLLSATMSATAGAHQTLMWTAETGAQSYNIYRQYEIAGGIADVGQGYGYVGNTSTTTFIDANILPDMSKSPPINFNPFSSGNNPGCSTYYQERHVFAGSALQPETLNLSKTGDFTNFDYCSPGRADDGIVATIASDQVNAVKHMVSMNSLIVLSASGAWKVDGGQLGGAITPTTIEAVPQAYNGCSDVRPIVINYDILYIQAKGSIVRDLTYNFYVNIYTGNDVTPLANHLFLGHQIVDWAWAEEPYKVVWAVREDGELLSFTFLKEQDVYAWAHHDTLNGKFKSVCSISEGQEDAVYFIVERFINGKYVYMQERLASRYLGAVPEDGVAADLSKAWFVDCGLQYPLNYPSANLTPAATTAQPAIVGTKVIYGGANYTAPTIVDLSGSGTVFSATVVGGVITAINVVTPGYTNGNMADLQITDATGSGAIAQGIVSSDLLIIADAAVFSSGSVGSMLRVNNGWGVVRAFNSSTSVTIDLWQPLTSTWKAAAGTWSCTAPVSTVTGLDHLNGATVSILADGNVQPQQTVVNGAITLHEPASAIFVGLPITAQLKSLYLDVPGASPTMQGKRVKVSAITVRVADSLGLECGLNFDVMDIFKERDYQQMGRAILPITGDQRVLLDSNYAVDQQICIRQTDPLPCTVLAFIPEISVGDTTR